MKSTKRSVDFYRPHPKDGGRCCFHRCLSVHIRGGVPLSFPMGNTPSFLTYPPVQSQSPSSPNWGGGYPHPSQQGWVVPPSFLTGGTPHQDWMGLPPFPPSGDRAATRRVVCRLCLRMTFSFKSVFSTKK